MFRIFISYYLEKDLFKRNYSFFLLHHLSWWWDFFNLKVASCFIFGAEWPLEYSKKKYFVDYSQEFPRVKYHGKYIYMPKNMSKKEIIEYIKSVDIEQDSRSCHCYFPTKNNLEGKVVVDIGGAEGNFAIDYIEQIDSLYIFEPDEKWILPLKKTYEKFIDKVTIVNGFVGNGNNGTIRLDDYLRGKTVDLLKMDVEGAEADVIRGALEIIRKSNELTLFVCMYHRGNDEDEIKNLLSGFKCNYREGYMFFLWEKPLKKPFLRRGVAEFYH